MSLTASSPLLKVTQKRNVLTSSSDDEQPLSKHLKQVILCSYIKSPLESIQASSSQKQTLSEMVRVPVNFTQKVSNFWCSRR
jgi:hypothetical protein